MKLIEKQCTFRISLGISHFYLLILIPLLLSCSNSGNEDVLTPEKPIPVEKVVRIEPDTSLHGATVKEWGEARRDLRESNCASFILMSFDSSEINDDEEFNEISKNLCSCIHDVIYGMPTMNENAILTEAKRCMDTMGYRQASDSLSTN
jgi:hypothetical protein